MPLPTLARAKFAMGADTLKSVHIIYKYNKINELVLINQNG
jgi:hypothetical protein